MQKRWSDELMPNATKCDGMAKIIASRGKQEAEPIVLFELLTVIVMLVGGLTVAVPTFCIELSQRQKIIKVEDEVEDDVEVWQDQTRDGLYWAWL